MSRPVDEALVRERSRRVAVQVAAVVGAAMLVVIALATLMVVRGEAKQTDRTLRSTARTADDVGDPPAGTWIVLRHAGATESTPGLPRALVLVLTAYSTTGFSTLETAGGPYRLYVSHRDGDLVQVVTDLRPQRADRDRMLRVMGTAAGLSLVVAGGIGVLIGRQAVRPMAEALALQRTFVADASHELRTPLTLLSTRVQVLERDLPPDASDALRTDVRGIRSDVQRMNDVVEDLLLAATPSAQDDRAPTDLRDVVTEVLAATRAHADERGVRLVQDDEGEAVAPVVVAAVRRAVLSLVDNAVDHTPPEGTVTVTTGRRRSEVVVTVADTGPGMTAEQAARVFERFRSGGQRAGRAHYGLGLALTHEVALRHGGRLSVVPSEGGAVLELVLPA